MGPYPLLHFTKYKSLVLTFKAWARKDTDKAQNKSSLATFAVVALHEGPDLLGPDYPFVLLSEGTRIRDNELFSISS